jgi:hypothetical protein
MDGSRPGGSVENGGLGESTEEQQKNKNYSQIDLKEKEKESGGEERWKCFDH